MTSKSRINFICLIIPFNYKHFIEINNLKYTEKIYIKLWNSRNQDVQIYDEYC